MMQAILAGSPNVFDTIWDFISSGYALVVYAIIIFVIIALLIVAVMSSERKKPNIIVSDAKNLGKVLNVDGVEAERTEQEKKEEQAHQEEEEQTQESKPKGKEEKK